MARQSAAEITTTRASAAFVAGSAVVIGLEVWYHDSLPHGQALVRASSVPAAIAGLAVLVMPLARNRVRVGETAMIGGVVLVGLHLAYVFANYATTVGIALLATVIAATMFDRPPSRLTRSPAIVVALLALLVGNFLYVYVDYGEIHRLGSIPASAVILAMRLTLAFLAFAAIATLARRAGDNRLQWDASTAVPYIGIVLVQLAYFSIDYFTDYRWRFVHATLVLVLAVEAALLVGRGESRRAVLEKIAVAALFGGASIEFVLFCSGDRGP